MKLLGTLPGPPPRPLYWLNAVDQLLEDLRVVDLGPGEHRDERCTVPVDEQVAFRAGSAAIYRVGTGLLPPFWPAC